MADAFCGPSNALQNFQKHSSVDRTLQQDRLVGRHSPSQGFRSSNSINAGALDSEFEAFQGGHAGPSQPQPLDLHHRLPPHLARTPQPPTHSAQPLGPPDWASDFQRLNLTNEHALGLQQQRGSPAAAAWHQDFLKQGAPALQAPAHQQQNGLGSINGGYGMGRFGGPGFQQPMGFGGMNGGMVAQPMQGKQPVQEAAPQFDEAAFEQAFAQVDQEMTEPSVQNLQSEQARGGSPTMQEAQSNLAQRDIRGEQFALLDNEVQANASQQESGLQSEDGATTDDPVLIRMREQQPAVYATLKLRSGIDKDPASKAVPYLAVLEKMEQAGTLVADASEAGWIVDTLQNMLDRGVAQEIQTRTETLIRAVNERLMSTYPLMSSLSMPLNQENVWEQLQAEGYTRVSGMEQQPQQRFQQERDQQLQSDPQQANKEQGNEQSLRTDDDAMADTAGRLLERVADNTSTKFQNSQFLELMRKLRDREVKVAEDKFVEVSVQSSSIPLRQTTGTPHSYPTQAPGQHQQSGASSAIPGIDPTILSHADTDFSLPVFSEEGHDEYAQAPPPLSRQSDREPLTDEISDQYSYYNINAAYHK